MNTATVTFKQSISLLDALDQVYLDKVQVGPLARTEANRPHFRQALEEKLAAQGITQVSSQDIENALDQFLDPARKSAWEATEHLNVPIRPTHEQWEAWRQYKSADIGLLMTFLVAPLSFLMMFVLTFNPYLVGTLAAITIPYAFVWAIRKFKRAQGMAVDLLGDQHEQMEKNGWQTITREEQTKVKKWCKLSPSVRRYCDLIQKSEMKRITRDDLTHMRKLKKAERKAVEKAVGKMLVQN